MIVLGVSLENLTAPDASAVGRPHTEHQHVRGDQPFSKIVVCSGTDVCTCYGRDEADAAHGVVLLEGAFGRANARLSLGV